MKLPGVYRISEDEVVESLVEGNMVSDNHSELYPPMFLPILSGGLSSGHHVPNTTLRSRWFVVALEKFVV